MIDIVLDLKIGSHNYWMELILISLIMYDDYSQAQVLLTRTGCRFAPD